MNASSHNCPRCGAPVTADERETGSCLACLLSLGAADETPRESTDPDGTVTDGSEAEGGPQAERIGPYTLVRTLGEGGMGVVYLAEQTEPIRREVAVKVIKLGMDTKRVVDRFLAERQALALMDHPAIASVHDAGMTPAGRPYFSMEYVDGEPITGYCDQHRLIVRSRLELFIRVCDGVQHAHQRGIIHRDIKPSNVLVTEVDGQPTPKIIDFGVAKATEQRLTEQTMFTELGVLIGTPAYMSPEQTEVSPLDVDTRTDVYSLGVLLYELLTGVLPLDARELRESAFDEIRRRIREEEPPTPSRRLASLEATLVECAQNRGVEAATLRRELSGDLDWITAKALEKDPDRRYGSPAELAADVARHLVDEPIIARPPSRAYQLGKFVRRNKLLVASLAAIFLAVAAGAAVATAFGVRATRARDDLQQVAAFQSQMLAQVDAEAMGRRLVDDLRQRGARARERAGEGDESVAAALAEFDEFVRGINPTNAALRAIDDEILGRAAETLDREFGDQPLIEAQLRVTLGNTYLQLGMAEPAEQHFQRAVELRTTRFGAHDARTLEANYALAGAMEEQGRNDEARALLIDVIEGQRDALGPQSEAVHRSKTRLASIHKGAGEFDEAARLFSAVLDEQSRTLGRDHPSTLVTMNGLGDLLAIQRRFEEAKALHLEIIERKRRTLGDDDPATLGSLHNLARMYTFQQNHAAAEEIYSDVYDARRRVLGDDHRQTLESLNSLALVHHSSGRYEIAEPMYVELLASRRRVLGAEHPDTLDAMNNFANVLLMTDRLDQAAGVHREVLGIRQRRFGEQHPRTAASRYNLATVLLNLGRFDEAETQLRQVVEVRERLFGREHPETLFALLQIAFAATLRGDESIALELIRDAVDRGWSDPSLFSSPGLASLQQSPEFERLRAIVTDRAQRE